MFSKVPSIVLALNLKATTERKFVIVAYAPIHFSRIPLVSMDTGIRQYEQIDIS
jgi:hypothetical protein